jgi:hypothetical protein
MRTPGLVSRAVWGESGRRLALCIIMLTVAACGDGTGPTTGRLELTTHTTGRDLDPDGYTLSVDGADATPLPANGTVSVTGLTPGDHAVTLAGGARAR